MNPIFVTTPGRSGTHWLSWMLRDLFGLTKVQVNYNGDWDATLAPLPVLSNRIYLQHPPLSKLAGKGFDIIVLVRDPRDVRISMWHYIQKSTSPEIVTRNWMMEENRREMNLESFWLEPQDKWWTDYCRTYRKVCHWRMRYEDLKDNPLHELKLLLKWLGKDVPQERVYEVIKNRSFDRFAAEDPVHYRCGLVGQWQEAFTEEQHDLFCRQHKTIMKTLGYLPAGGRTAARKRAYGISI